MPELTHFPADASSADILETINAEGAVIIDGLVDQKTIARLRTQTDPYMTATENGQDDFSGRLTTRTGGLVSRSADCCDLVMHPRILELCDGFLLPNQLL